METKKSVFETLNAINCNEHTEKKNGLTYLSWAWAWQIVKKNYPDAYYTIYENADGYNYFHDGRTAWVKTGVTIEGLELIEELPVMDFRNASIMLDKLTSFDVNKAIQRSLTKACARHGLGLYIYAGEDLPETDPEAQQTAGTQPSQAVQARRASRKKATVPMDAPSDGYVPMSEANYRAIVKAFATGKKTRTGGDYKKTWIETTNADAEAILRFDNDVEEYRMANNL